MEIVGNIMILKTMMKTLRILPQKKTVTMIAMTAQRIRNKKLAESAQRARR
jgi:hypothetical protein